MPLIQFDIPKDLDKKIRFYMIKNDKEDKKLTIIELLRKCLK